MSNPVHVGRLMRSGLRGKLIQQVHTYWALAVFRERAVLLHPQARLPREAAG